MLIVFAGLPGVGKTTLACALATRRTATYLRIDEIEQALRAAGNPVGPAGYVVAQALAASNLALGNTVVADCVNPVPESRDGWRCAAARAGTRILELEIVCTDPAEHRRRVESRRPDIPGHHIPTWQDVITHDYQPWNPAPLRIDTATQTPDQALAAIERALHPP